MRAMESICEQKQIQCYCSKANMNHVAGLHMYHQLLPKRTCRTQTQRLKASPEVAIAANLGEV
eukprot:1044206-Amphidinium_carterae.1